MSNDRRLDATLTSSDVGSDATAPTVAGGGPGPDAPTAILK
jgi:hypothetical protein